MVNRPEPMKKTAVLAPRRGVSGFSANRLTSSTAPSRIRLRMKRRHALASTRLLAVDALSLFEVLNSNSATPPEFKRKTRARYAMTLFLETDLIVVLAHSDICILKKPIMRFVRYKFKKNKSVVLPNVKMVRVFEELFSANDYVELTLHFQIPWPGKWPRSR